MITKEEMQKNIGRYIRFGGNGIIDGLKLKKCKFLCYRIAEISDDNLILKSYRCKKNRWLPAIRWNQEFEIIGTKEYKSLPAY